MDLSYVECATTSLEPVASCQIVYDINISHSNILGAFRIFRKLNAPVTSLLVKYHVISATLSVLPVNKKVYFWI